MGTVERLKQMLSDFDDGINCRENPEQQMKDTKKLLAAFEAERAVVEHVRVLLSLLNDEAPYKHEFKRLLDAADAALRELEGE